MVHVPSIQRVWWDILRHQLVLLLSLWLTSVLLMLNVTTVEVVWCVILMHGSCSGSPSCSCVPGSIQGCYNLSRYQLILRWTLINFLAFFWLNFLELSCVFFVLKHLIWSSPAATSHSVHQHQYHTSVECPYHYRWEKWSSVLDQLSNAG